MRDSVLGAVLAGGSSRRMGRDKARLRLAGQPLAARAASCLAARIEDVVLVSRRVGDHADLGWPEIADRFPGRGPLAGLDAALRHAAGRPVFVLACDLPGVGPELVGRLLEEAAPLAAVADAPWCVVAEAALGPQPLCGVYSAACGRLIEARLEDGRLAVMGLLEEINCRRLRLEAGPGAEALANVNRPEEGRRLGIESADR